MKSTTLFSMYHIKIKIIKKNIIVENYAKKYADYFMLDRNRGWK